MTDNTKAGARNSTGDKGRLKQIAGQVGIIGDAAEAISELIAEIEPGMGEDEQPEPDDAGEMMSYQGGVVKSLPDGKIGGYLVRFGTPDATDLTGDFFTKDTDFGEAITTPVFYQHGMDATLKRRKLGTGTLTVDEFGVWCETQIKLRDDYERFIQSRCEAGKMGWSSGTAGHLVEREQVGKATWLKMWLLGLDASLTPNPAEPRNAAIPLKSLSVTAWGIDPEGAPEAVTTAASEGETEQAIKSIDIIKELDTMTPEEIQKLVTDAANEAVKAFAATMPPTNAGGYAEPINHNDKPFKTFGEQLDAVRKFYVNPGGAPSEKLLAVKAASGSNELVPSDGGFLIQPDFANELMQRAYDQAVLASRCRRIPISSGANGLIINAIDETSRATGSRWGGVQGYRLAEAGSATATKPKFRQMEFKLKKYGVLAYATDELVADITAMQSVISQAASAELAFMLDDDIYNGLGTNGPLGIMASASLVTVAKEGGQAAATLTYNNVKAMWARLWSKSMGNAIWLVNQDVLPQLFEMSVAIGVGGVPVFLPPSGASGSPYSTLFGRPVIPCEFSATLGTAGDVLLADLSQYALVDKGGVQAASSIHVQFAADETTFRFVYRIDGQPLWSSTLTPYKGSSTLSPFVNLAVRA